MEIIDNINRLLGDDLKQTLRSSASNAGLKDSVVKINVEPIFKLLSPATDVKCL
jgi:adenine-specific DNA-methyltransferase